VIPITAPTGRPDTVAPDFAVWRYFFVAPANPANLSCRLSPVRGRPVEMPTLRPSIPALAPAVQA
jgi:hypothetical protein